MPRYQELLSEDIQRVEKDGFEICTVNSNNVLKSHSKARAQKSQMGGNS